MNAAFSSLLTLFSPALVLHTLDRAIAYCMCISLSQQIGSNCTSPFNAGEMFRIRNTFRPEKYIQAFLAFSGQKSTEMISVLFWPDEGDHSIIETLQ